MRWFLALCLLATRSGCCPLPAGGCRAVSYRSYAVEKEVQAIVAVPVVVPIFSYTYLPSYTAIPQPVQPVYAPVQQPVYTPPQQPLVQQPMAPAPVQPVQAPGDCCLLLVGELAKLRGELHQLRTGGVLVNEPLAAPTPGPAVPLSGLGVLQVRCAQCHGASVAAAQGGGFTLFEASGQLVPLSVPTKQRIIQRVSSGPGKRMPPEPHAPLSQAEFDALRLLLGV